MKLFKLFVAIIMFFSGSILFAQSNEIIDDVLSQKELSCGNGAYLILTASGKISEDSTTEEALAFLKEKKWIKKDRTIVDAMSLGEYSLAVMKSFSLTGGLMYTLFPSGRYASRELGYKGYIRRDQGAYRSVRGTEAISLIGTIARSMEK